MAHSARQAGTRREDSARPCHDRASMTSSPTAALLAPRPSCSPARGTVPIRAFFFDTYGTVCDFFQPFKRALTILADSQGVVRDTATLAIAWRNAYMHSVRRHVAQGLDFRPLRSLQRDDLRALLAAHFPYPLDAQQLDEMTSTWRKLDPWPDSVEGLLALKQRAIIAPLSNGNFDDMVMLARHAQLPWDVIVGSSVARTYKPHPDIYLKSVAALNLDPAEVCMVAAHQGDLHHAAGHGMQTAFVTRPLEFGGPTRPPVLEADVDYSGAAEIYADGEWTYIARDLLDLAAQHAAT